MTHTLVDDQTNDGDRSLEVRVVARSRMVVGDRQVVVMWVERFRIPGNEQTRSFRTCHILENHHRRSHWLASSQVGRRQ